MQHSLFHSYTLEPDSAACVVLASTCQKHSVLVARNIWASTSPTRLNEIGLPARLKHLAISSAFQLIRKAVSLKDKPNKAWSRKFKMSYFVFVAAIFGVLKSKCADGLDCTFWVCLIFEFVLASLSAAALFTRAFRVELQNRDMRIATSSLAFAITGTLLVAEAVYVGRKLKAGSWFMFRLHWVVLTVVVLFAFLIAPTIPIYLAVLRLDVNDCFAVNRSLLDALTIIVTSTPVICLVTGFIACKIFSKLKVTKRFATCMAMFVAYIFYSVPVLGLGILLMQTPSNCDKHTILLVYNLMPAAVICCSALALREDKDEDSGNPEVLDEYRGVELSDGTVSLPEQSNTSRVSDGVNSN